MTIKMPDWMEDDQELQVPASPGTAGSVPQTSPLATAPVQRKASSGFTNLKKYIQANRNNNLGDLVTKQAQDKLSSAEQNLQSAQSQFNTGLSEERAKIQGSAGEANKALNYIETGTQPLTQVQNLTAIEKPKAPVSWDENYDQKLADYNTKLEAYNTYTQQKAQDEAKKNLAAADTLRALRNYSYSGPSTLNNADKLAADRFEIQDFARATGSEAGRGAILQTLFGRGGQYTAGTRNLDNIFLGADQSAMDKLKNIRTQAANYDQNLNQAQRQAQSGSAAIKGSLDIEKAKNELAMKNLRDSIKAKLEQEAAAYNTAQQADLSQIDDAELKQWLPELAAYDVVALPNQVDPRQAPRLSYQRPDGLDAPSQIGLPVVNPEDLKYINLYRNKNFEEHQKVDPNRILTRQIKEAGSVGHRDWTHSSTGQPNAQEAYVDIGALKPLFKEQYTDNTWQSINKDVLERRNILSQVLADDAQNGLVTPQERQEIQVQLDNQLLSGLKETPKRAEEVYNQSFFTNALGAPETEKVIRDYTQLGYQDPVSLMNDMNINLRTRLTSKDGQPLTTGAFKYNPETKLLDYKNTIYTIRNPKTGTTYKFDGINYKPIDPKPQDKQFMTVQEFKNAKLLPENYPVIQSVRPEDVLNNVIWGKGGFDNNSSPGLLAKKYQEKAILDRLKELGITNPNIKVV